MRLLVVMMLLLAGCGQPAAPAPEPEAPERSQSTVQIEDRSPGDNQTQATGDLRGTVVNDLNLTQADAHVSLIGTGLFTSTNTTGEFAFTDLQPGPYELRVDAVEHDSAELGVQVIADKVTVVRVVVLIPEDRVGDMRPHQHDHWRGQDTYVLMEAPVDLLPHHQYAQTNAYSRAFVLAFYAGFLALNNSFAVVPPALDDGPAIVLPGTKEIEVTLSWDVTDATNTDLGFAVLPPGREEWQATLPAPSGATHHFQVDPTTTDSGHQEWSFWQFRIHEGPGTEGVTVGVHPGQAHVKIVLHRGPVAYEAPHRDFWGDETSLVLMDETRRAASTGGARDAPSTMVISLPEDAMVPPGTTRMRIEMSYAHVTAPVPKDVGLAWRTGEQNPATTKAFDFKRAPPVDSTASSKVYELDLESQETDQYYQSVTNWLFKVTFPEDEYVGSYAGESWDIHLKVEVWR